MGKFEMELLKLAYENYQKTGDAAAEKLLKNGDEFLYYTSAAEYLAEQNYIIPLSDNILADRVDISDISGTLLRFELTEKGLQYVTQHLTA